jgi:hypothetical protein
MKLDIPDEYLPLIVNALEHYHAYTRAAQPQLCLYGRITNRDRLRIDSLDANCTDLAI